MSSEENSDPEYIVEEIRDHCEKDGVPFYLVKWEGYESSDNTWEPKENLRCPFILKAYKAKLKKLKSEGRDDDAASTSTSSSSKRSKRSKDKSKDKSKSISKKQTIEQPSFMDTSSNLPSIDHVINQLSNIPTTSKSADSSMSEFVSPVSETNNKQSQKVLNPDEELKRQMKIVDDEIQKVLDDLPQSRQDVIVHDLTAIGITNNEDEPKILDFKDQTEINFDDYDFTDENEEIEDYRVSFVWPKESKPSRIISLCSINDNKYFIVLFEDGKTYYIRTTECFKECQSLVFAYTQTRFIHNVEKLKE